VINVDGNLQHGGQDGEQRRRTPTVFLRKRNDKQIIPQNTSLVLSKSFLEVRDEFPVNKNK
jgi:hypothetical protein